MRDDRVKKNKRVLKTLHSQGFRQPFQIIVDSSFARQVNKVQRGVGQIQGIFRDYPKYFITKCEYEKHKKCMRERGDITGQCEIIKCSHEDAETDCLGNLIKDDNKHHYILATADPSVVRKYREHKKLPMLRIRNSLIVVDAGGMERISAKYQGEAAGKKELKALRKMFGDVS